MVSKESGLLTSIYRCDFILDLDEASRGGC